ncbi:MAG: Xaa-Pro aminopeptidase [Polyangiaceae bacterium]|jgi:Xaa-Pro aminopeptidase|nr:Xaa-Pro aminopeptidase [Polyangiaceae bacterium]
MWTKASQPQVFAARRARLSSRLRGPALLVAGLSRPRNFQHNRFPFRAESHFLYLVGRSIEGAALLIHPKGATLFAPPADPEAELWTGPMPSLTDWSNELGLEVRPIEELQGAENIAALPPQDLDCALWLSELLDRDLEPGGGEELQGADAELAESMIALRLSHDDAAVAQLKEAAAVTHRAHLAGMRATRPELREASIRAAMEAEIIAAGCATAYGSIVTVHGEVLHNERHDGVLTKADLLLADVGAETPEGFAGDVTRTWPVSGRFSGTQREAYEVVLAAQLAAIAKVAPGVRYLDVHRAAGLAMVEGLIGLGILRGSAADLYARGAAALFFPHGVGHLLGLDVHDMEDLGDRAGYAPGRSRAEAPGDRYLRLDRDLAPGMCVTIEPGFYQIPRILARAEEVGELESALDRAVLARFADVRGIRIEDDVLVTPTGYEVLSAAVPKSVDDVQHVMV